MWILLADDHTLVREVEVFEAPGHAEADAIAAREPDLDLIILDLVMPGMDGGAGVRHMVATYPDVPLSSSPGRTGSGAFCRLYGAFRGAPGPCHTVPEFRARGSPVMPLRRLLLHAARHIAADPRVQAKAIEVIKTEIKPRAQAVLRHAKPKLRAVKADLEKIVLEADPRTEPMKFAAKLKERFIGHGKTR